MHQSKEIFVFAHFLPIYITYLMCSLLLIKKNLPQTINFLNLMTDLYVFCLTYDF